ncbi:GNAT family N-acetyltransferase [Bifidobacterium eulemuris]|uniref:GNAT family N-acetyltransferase n=2 Tax=Bifidobacterium eulemuris TaxID=1765219 RepID=A0A261GCP0_9BIFI|nr:GNAT family N-acetyltransferase [Bifidobacterium eulemuris]OZG69211.1 GNAT family N-acetyltransferase [Bifidobacterium eulemuris]QOL31279.1 GNAT family N-acetyltransferase [Bifidobacterium eulemuris]
MTESTPIIRAMRRDDLPRIEQLTGDMWYAEYEPKVGAALSHIDVEHCLARATFARVAELNGEIVGFILASIPAHTTQVSKLRHTVRMVGSALTLLADAAGRRGLDEFARIAHVDDRLLRDAGPFDAEVVLFVLAPAARGHGLGKRMFDAVMEYFAANGIDEYFLFTDTTCDYTFYEHRGLERRGALPLETKPGDCYGSEPPTFFVYSGTTSHGPQAK